jgi:DNA-binding MarR family transcriptional regulator
MLIERCEWSTGNLDIKMTTETKVLDFITHFCLGSHDFNGVPVATIRKELDLSADSVHRALRRLLQKKQISIVSSEQDINPHIKRLAEESQEKQITRLDNERGLICVYPSSTRLLAVVDPHSFEGRPFTLKMALGAPQLAFESFDLSVLQIYRDDPRYDYYNNDIYGRVGLKDEETIRDLGQSDQVILESFGYSYDPEHYRAVGAFLRYLSRLSPEHQQIWNAKLLMGDYKMHPCYYRSMILGEWPDCTSVVDALSLDIIAINKVCKLMNRPPLFNDELLGAPGAKVGRGIIGFIGHPTHDIELSRLPPPAEDVV